MPVALAISSLKTVWALYVSPPACPVLFSCFPRCFPQPCFIYPASSQYSHSCLPVVLRSVALAFNHLLFNPIFLLSIFLEHNTNIYNKCNHTAHFTNAAALLCTTQHVTPGLTEKLLLNELVTNKLPAQDYTQPTHSKLKQLPPIQ